MVFLAAAAVLLLIPAAPLNSQTSSPQTPAAHTPTPQWQIDAGGKMSFDIASVKQNNAPGRDFTSNFPLGGTPR
jgi:hypothetical protein